MGMLLLPAAQFPDIELQCRQQRVQHSNTYAYLEFFSFKNVAICTTTLPWSTRDRRVQTPCHKLLLQKKVQLGIWGTVSLLIGIRV